MYLGFKQIHVIDLDTIDVSNLNRQFLFRPEHVGQSKSKIAAEQVMKFNPDVNITAYHDNIKNNAIFNIPFFESFDVVLNGLDNVDARRHVNRLCLAAKTPLIDSGTTGYLGQVMPILGKVTACYECFPKPTQKEYPECTIRSTPDKPVHCIVWAKECFKLLFAKASDSRLYEDDSNTGDKSVYMNLITFPALEERGLENICNFAKKLIIGLYHDDIQKKIDMNLYKTAKCVPKPIQPAIIDQAVDVARQRIQQEYLQPSCSTSLKNGISSQVFAANSTFYGAGWDHRRLSVEENLIEFVFCLYEIVLKEAEEQQTLLGQLSFDKDDFWAMRFVAAASNIRSSIFGIEMQSFHDAKGILFQIKTCFLRC